MVKYIAGFKLTQLLISLLGSLYVLFVYKTSKINLKNRKNIDRLFKKNESYSIEESLNQLVEDSNLRVRTQMAFSLGEWKSPTAGNLLAKLARDCSELPDLQIAIASSAKGHSVKILKGILNVEDVLTTAFSAYPLS